MLPTFGSGDTTGAGGVSHVTCGDACAGLLLILGRRPTSPVGPVHPTSPAGCSLRHQSATTNNDFRSARQCSSEILPACQLAPGQNLSYYRHSCGQQPQAWSCERKSCRPASVLSPRRDRRCFGRGTSGDTGIRLGMIFHSESRKNLLGSSASIRDRWLPCRSPCRMPRPPRSPISGLASNRNRSLFRPGPMI